MADSSLLARRERLRTGQEGLPHTVTTGMHFFVVDFGEPTDGLPRLVLSGTYLGTVNLPGGTQVRVHLDGDPDAQGTHFLPSILGLDNSRANTRLAVDNLNDLRVTDVRPRLQSEAHPI